MALHIPLFGDYQLEPVKTAACIISDDSDHCSNEPRGASTTNLHHSNAAPTSSDSQRHHPSSKTTKKGGNNKRYQDPDAKERNREIQRRYREKSKMKVAEAEVALEKLRLDLQKAQEEKAALLSQATVLSQVNVYLDETITAISGAVSKAAQTFNQTLPIMANFATMSPLEVVNVVAENNFFPPDAVIRRRLRLGTLEDFLKQSKFFYSKVTEFVQQWNDNPSSRQLVEQKLGACLKFRCKVATILRDERPDVLDALIFGGEQVITCCSPDTVSNLEMTPKQFAQMQVAWQEFKAKQAVLNKYNDFSTQAFTESVKRSVEASSMKDQFSAHITAFDAACMLEAQNKQRLHAILNLYISLNETLTPIQMGKFLLANKGVNVGPPGLIAFHQASLIDSLNLMGIIHTEDDGHLLSRREDQTNPGVVAI